MTVDLASTNEKMAFTAHIPNRPDLAIDYVSPVGDDQGYTSLELLLTALGSCTASGVGLLLRRRARRAVPRVQAHVEGDRADTNPTVFTQLRVHLTIESPDATEDEVAQVLEAAETTICPVYVMVAKSTPIATTWTLVRP